MNKPDFTGGTGAIVDPLFIPKSIRDELLLHLQRSPLNHSQKNAFLDYANNIGQTIFEDDLETGKNQREQVEAVASNARRLLASMRMLSQSARDAIRAHSDFLAYGSDPPIDLGQTVKTQITSANRTLLDGAWDWTAALEAASAYTSEKFNIDKTSKPGQMRARDYVTMLAECVQGLTGGLPPKDPASWFMGFAACLGDYLDPDSPIGPRIVNSGIEAAR